MGESGEAKKEKWVAKESYRFYFCLCMDQNRKKSSKEGEEKKQVLPML